MYIYFLILFAVFIGFLYYSKRPDPLAYNVIFGVSAVILCSGYMCGSDWRAYETIYNSYVEGDFWWRIYFVEPFYLLLNVAGNELGLGFWSFYILLKFLIFAKVVKILKEYSEPRLLLLSFLFYLGFWGIMIFIDPPFRNMISVYLFLCSIKSIQEKNFRKFLLFTIVATLFHYSSLILFVFYYFLQKRLSTRTIVLLFIISNILFLKPDIVFGILAKLLSFIPAISYKIENYTVGIEADKMGNGKLFSVVYFIHILFFCGILYFRHYIERMKSGVFVFNMSVLFILVFRLGLSILIFSRLQLYIAPFYSVAVAYLIYAFQKRYRVALVFLVFLMCLASNFNQMRNVYMVPYTNYFVNMDNNFSFEYRSEYNYKKSPYKNIEK